MSAADVEDLQMSDCPATPASEDDVEAGGEQEEFEDDTKRLLARQRQIDFGKNTLGYERYIKAVPKHKRRMYGKNHDPPTPDITQKLSRKRWDGIVKAWRRHLHKYDNMDEQEFGKRQWQPRNSSRAAQQVQPSTGTAEAAAPAAMQVDAELNTMSRQAGSTADPATIQVGVAIQISAPDSGTKDALPHSSKHNSSARSVGSGPGACSGGASSGGQPSKRSYASCSQQGKQLEQRVQDAAPLSDKPADGGRHPSNSSNEQQQQQQQWCAAGSGKRFESQLERYRDMSNRDSKAARQRADREGGRRDWHDRDSYRSGSRSEQRYGRSSGSRADSSRSWRRQPHARVDGSSVAAGGSGKAAGQADDGCYSLSEGEIDPRCCCDGGDGQVVVKAGRRRRSSGGQLTPAKRGSNSQEVLDGRPMKC